MIEIYTTTTCPHCKVIKDQLKQAKIDFIEKNTDKDEVAMAELVTEDIWSVPVIKYNGNFIKTFNIELIKGLLK